MRLNLVSTLLRSHAPDLKLPAWHAEPWVPFPEATGAQFRRIRLFKMPPIGRGGFGIVFAALLEVPEPDGSDGARHPDGPLVALAAMKMMALLKDHCVEVSNALVVNDLVRSGCTPGVTRLLDAFCLSTTATVTQCQMPPDARRDAAWGEYLWEPFDRFVYAKRAAITSHLGDDAIRGLDDVRRTARLNGGASLGFAFTELSTRFLYEFNTVRGSGPVVSLEDDARDKAITGIMTGRDLMQTLFLAGQAVDALHANNLLHCDIHRDNILHNRTALFRSAHCALAGDDTRALRAAFFGPRAHTRLSLLDCDAPLVVRTTDEEGSATLFGFDVSATTQPLLIDLGNAVRAHFPAHAATLESVERLLLGAFEEPADPAARPRASEARARALRQLPTHIVSWEPLRFNDLASLRDRVPSTAPALSVLSYPKTNPYTCCPEQLNPFEILGTVRSPDLPHRGVYLAFHSELSDGYSFGATACELILGFAPFGDTLRASVGARPQGALNGGANTRLRGARLARVEGAGGKDEAFTLVHAPYAAVLRRSAPEIRAGEVHLRVSSASTSPASPMPPSDSGSGPADDVFTVRAANPTAKLAAYIVAALGARRSTPCAFYGYKPDSAGVAPAGWGAGDKVLLRACESVIARIQAVGFPDAADAKSAEERLSGLRGTVLYNFFKAELAEMKRAKRDKYAGWLYPALMDALQHHWGLEFPRATELAKRLVDMLAWDPAQRPPVRALLNCAVFREMFALGPAQIAALPLATTTVWSAVRPTARNCPAYFRAEPSGDMLSHLAAARTGRPTEPSILALVQTPPPEARLAYSAADWQLAAFWPVACFRALYHTHGVLSGFLLKFAHRLPALLSQDAGVAALFNCLTGVLDCHTGQVCITFGREKRAAALADADTNVIFKDEVAQRAYFTTLRQFVAGGANIASWPFATARDVPAAAASPRGAKRKRAGGEEPAEDAARDAKRARRPEEED